jgi:hypothetical protein
MCNPCFFVGDDVQFSVVDGWCLLAVTRLPIAPGGLLWTVVQRYCVTQEA